MAKIKIDDIEFESDTLDDEGKAILGSLAFVQNEIKRIENQMKIYKRAEISWAQSLKEVATKK